MANWISARFAGLLRRLAEWLDPIARADVDVIVMDDQALRLRTIDQIEEEGIAYLQDRTLFWLEGSFKEWMRRDPRWHLNAPGSFRDD